MTRVGEVDNTGTEVITSGEITRRVQVDFKINTSHEHAIKLTIRISFGFYVLVYVNEQYNG